MIRIVQRGQRRVVQERPLAREWDRSIVNNGVGEGGTRPGINQYPDRVGVQRAVVV